MLFNVVSFLFTMFTSFSFKKEAAPSTGALLEEIQAEWEL